NLNVLFRLSDGPYLSWHPLHVKDWKQKTQKKELQCLPVCNLRSNLAIPPKRDGGVYMMQAGTPHLIIRLQGRRIEPRPIEQRRLRRRREVCVHTAGGPLRSAKNYPRFCQLSGDFTVVKKTYNFRPSTQTSVLLVSATYQRHGNCTSADIRK